MDHAPCHLDSDPGIKPEVAEQELKDIRAIAHKARTDTLAQIAVKKQ